jgi:mRNA-degrading endonuclease RelE of RelBE toxin-antitoxin system
MLNGWKIRISKQANNFIEIQNFSDDFVRQYIMLALQKFDRQDVNIEIKKLSGKWEGFYRIRSGKIRIVCSFDFKLKIAEVEEIDFRGNSYK